MKEIPYKQWKCMVAQKLKIHPATVQRRLLKFPLACPPLHRVNSRVIYVRVP